jgi:hypothetical protein
MHFPAGAGKCKKPPGGGRLAHASLGVQMLQGDGGPSKALDQGALDGAQPIGATEITFDIGDKAIECLRRASATVELAARKQLPRVALCERRRAGFARLSGWQPVGNWVASAGEFSSIPVSSRRYPDNEQKNRDAQFAPKNGQKPKPSRLASVHLFGSQERAETIPAAG